MKLSRLLLQFAWLPLVLLVGAPACDQPDDLAEQEAQADQPFVLRLEFGLGDPAIEAPLFVEVSAIDLHGQGGWETYEQGRTVIVEPGASTLAARILGHGNKIKEIRVHGTFSFVQGDELVEIELKPTRDLQINLSARLEVGKVNHVYVDLSKGIDVAKGTLQPVATSTPTTTADFTFTQVTPAFGGVLALEDGFELVVPPAAADQEFIAYVERIESPDGGWYYEVGPDGTTFEQPVTAKIPTEIEEGYVSWDFELLDGVFDDQHRLVASNDHFCPLSAEAKELPYTDVDGRGAAFLFNETGWVNGYGDFSIMIIDLWNPQISVESLLGKKSGPEIVGSGHCASQEVYDWSLVNAQFAVQDGFQRIAAIAADNYHPYNAPINPNDEDDVEVDETHGCARDFLVVESKAVHLNDDTHTEDKYIIEFKNLIDGVGANVKVSSLNPDHVTEGMVMPQSAITSRYRYIHNGANEVGPTDFLCHSSRSALAFANNGRFMVLAVAQGVDQKECKMSGDGFTGEEWANILLQPRTIKMGSNDVVVTIEDAYRLDEGSRPNLVYGSGATDAEGSIKEGIRILKGGTINSLGVYWKDKNPCTYQMTSHSCYTWTTSQANPNPAPQEKDTTQNRELMEICGFAKPDGCVEIHARKYNDNNDANDEFGNRPYQVRVSTTELECYQGAGFTESSTTPTNVDAQLSFIFPSIWKPGQKEDKDYCVTASTQPGDLGYDPNSAAQETWWWSDKVTLTRTCSSP